MIVLDVAQGSHAWQVARLGIPTASQFHRIITPKTRKTAAGAAAYRNELLSEWALGKAFSAPPTGFMDRGTAMEAEARRYAEFQQGYTAERVGFILRDDRMVGGSPDALVGDDGGLEIKCPSAANHVGYLLGDGADAYFSQIQGYLWLTGRKWWDLVSYNPEIPSALTRHRRDEGYIRDLAAAVDRFVESLHVGREALEALGVVPQEPVTEAEERAALTEAMQEMPF